MSRNFWEKATNCFYLAPALGENSRNLTTKSHEGQIFRKKSGLTTQLGLIGGQRQFWVNFMLNLYFVFVSFIAPSILLIHFSLIKKSFQELTFSNSRVELCGNK